MPSTFTLQLGDATATAFKAPNGLYSWSVAYGAEPVAGGAGYDSIEEAFDAAMAELDEQSSRFNTAPLLPPLAEDAEGTVVSAHVAPDLLDKLESLVEHNRTVRQLDANATIDGIFRCGLFAYARMLDKADQPAGAVSA